MSGKGAYNDGDLSRLAGYLHQPFTLNKVRAALRESPYPSTLRDVVQRTGLAAHRVHHSLTRLTEKGEVRRTFVYERRHNFNRTTNKIVPGASNRRLYAYQIIEGGE